MLSSLAQSDWWKNRAKSRIWWTSEHSLAVKYVYNEDNLLHGWRGWVHTCRASVPSHPFSFRSLSLTVCMLPGKCQWWERRTGVLHYFTKAYNLLMLLYHLLLKSHPPRVPSWYLLPYRQAVKILAGILTLKWLGKAVGIRLSGLFCVFTLFFSKDSSQHYASIQSSDGDKGLVEANDGLSLVCSGAKRSTEGWGLSVGRVLVSIYLLSSLKIVVQRLVI